LPSEVKKVSEEAIVKQKEFLDEIAKSANDGSRPVALGLYASGALMAAVLGAAVVL
jgi:hypothetical protein